MTEARLSSDYDPFLAQLGAAPPIESLSVDDARAMWDMMDFGEAAPLREVRDFDIPGPAGVIPARAYVPDGSPAALIVYFHGGGWMLGGLKSHDKALRALAAASGCAIVAVGYRLAPEHPFPAGFEDAVAATRWASEHRDVVGCAGKPLIVAGDSAGGNLAAAVAIGARDAGGPGLAGQVLIYPATDAGRSTPSYGERGSGGLLSAADMRWFWNHYLPDEALGVDPRASPWLTTSLAGLPPSIVVTAEFDPLRDEGVAFADRLAKEGGGRVTHLHFADQPHGFFTFFQAAPSAAAAFAHVADAVRALADEAVA